MSGNEFVTDEIIAERDRQDVKWGIQHHVPVMWISILMEELGEAAKEANEAAFAMHSAARNEYRQNYRRELIQVAAVAAAAIECLDKEDATGEL